MRSDEVEALLDEELQTFYPDLNTDGIHIECRPYSQRSTYPLIRCRILRDGTQIGPALIAKYTPVYPDNIEGSTEFEHLRLMESQLSGRSDLKVPHAVAFLADRNLLITEETGGIRFPRILMRDCSMFTPSSRYERLRLHIRRCGDWLAEFHRATGSVEKQAFGEDYRKEIETKLSALTEFGFPAACARLVRETVDQLSSYGETHHTMYSGFHGDFGPQNIHIDGESVCVFDLSYNRKTPIYDDIGYFGVTLETMNPFPRHIFFLRSRAMKLQSDFLDGYFPRDGVTSHDRIMLDGYYLKALLYRCHKQRRNVAGMSAPIRIYFDRFKVGRSYPRRIERQCISIQDGIK